MNKIPQPQMNDCAALESLANNPRVNSYPGLQGSVLDIQEGYAHYVAACGNAFNVPEVRISPAVENHLRSHFRSPPNDLKHIRSMRKSTGHSPCPMCGSLHSGTLDHLLPQRDYAAFAVFSLNLVPACKCNSIRQELLIGPNANERILHPYFDECLTERLIKAHFVDLGSVPRIELQLCIDNAHPEYPSIDFHFRSIVKRMPVTGYLRSRWSDLCRKPSLIVRALDKKPLTHKALREILEQELELLDDQHHSKNNWNSIFVAGLLDQEVLHWLFRQLTAVERSLDGPLVDL